MPTAKPVIDCAFSPQYFIINRSEPQFDRIKKQLLDPSRPSIGSSYYFIRAGPEKSCICRINAVNDTVLFYEIVNHLQEGISDDDVAEAVHSPSNSSPVPGYFYITPRIEEKLRAFLTPGNIYCGKECETHSLA